MFSIKPCFFKAESLCEQLPLLSGRSRETWGLYRVWEAWPSEEEIRGPALTVTVTKTFQPNRLFPIYHAPYRLTSQRTWPPSLKPKSLPHRFFMGRWLRFQRPNEENLWESAYLHPSDLPISACGGMESSFQGQRPRPIPAPLLALVTGPPGVSVSDWSTRPPLRARSGRDHAPYVWTLDRLERPRNRRPEGRRAVVLEAAMVLSSLAEPTQTRRSRPWRWGAGGVGQSVLVTAIWPGRLKRLLFASAVTSPAPRRAPRRPEAAGSGGNPDRRLGSWPAGWVSWVVGRSQFPQRFGQRGRGPAPPAIMLGGPLSAPGPARILGGRRQTRWCCLTLCAFAHSMPSPVPSPWTNSNVGSTAGLSQKGNHRRKGKGVVRRVVKARARLPVRNASGRGSQPEGSVYRLNTGAVT